MAPRSIGAGLDLEGSAGVPGLRGSPRVDIMSSFLWFGEGYGAQLPSHLDKLQTGQGGFDARQMEAHAARRNSDDRQNFSLDQFFDEPAADSELVGKLCLGQVVRVGTAWRLWGVCCWHGRTFADEGERYKLPGSPM